MSTDQRRQRDIIINVVQALRRDSDLTDLVYADASAPETPHNRSRIHEGDPARDDHAMQVAVMPVTAGGTWRGGQHSTTHTIQCTIECSQAFYESHSHLHLLAVHDRCGAVLTSPVANGVYPLGTAGSGSVHEIGDSGRRTRTARWRVRVHQLTY